MQKIKKFKSEIAQFSQNKANFPPFFLLTFSSGGIPPPQIPPFLLSSGGTLSIVGSNVKVNVNKSIPILGVFFQDLKD